MKNLISAIGQKASQYMVSDEISAKLDQIPNQLNELEYDNWGMHPQTIKHTLTICRWLYDYYFRVQLHGIEKVPNGRVLLVPNHSGQLPLDGMLLFHAMAIHANPPRVVRGMVERLVPRLPFVGTWMMRCGQAVGDPVNCKRLLENEEAVFVFPEGVRGSGKVYWKRYNLQRFGTGFMRLALETQTPIVPIAFIGTEETYPSIYNWKFIAKLFKLPYFPITPFWPLLGPLGMLPVPSKIHIHFGEPLCFEGDFDGPEKDIHEKVDAVKDTIQNMIHNGLKKRGHRYF